MDGRKGDPQRSVMHTYVWDGLSNHLANFPSSFICVYNILVKNTNMTSDSELNMS